MSETFSQAAKRLLAGLDAKAKIVHLPVTPAGRALLRHVLQQNKMDGATFSNRNFDHEAATHFSQKMGRFNLKKSEH